MTGARKGAGEGVMPGMTSNKKTTQRQGFKTNEFIVYPAHGVGQIMAIEEQEVAGAKLELFVINFIKDKMTLRVPTAKIVSVGMRKLAEGPLVKRALETLKGRARIRNTKPRSIPATSSPSPRSCATSIGRKPSPSSLTRSGSFTKPRSTGSRARSLPCSA
jgi:hypothetical protein